MFINPVFVDNFFKTNKKGRTKKSCPNIATATEVASNADFLLHKRLKTINQPNIQPEHKHTASVAA